MNSLNLNLDRKVQAINRYLIPKLDTQPQYQDLIDELTVIIQNWQQNPIRLTIISHSEKFIKDIKLLKKSNLKLHSLCTIQTASLPNNLDWVLGNCDLLCLVSDGGQKISRIEHRLIDKIVENNKIGYCLILTDSNNSSKTYHLKTTKHNNLSNYLTHKGFHKILSYFLPKKYFESTVSSEDLKEYHQFLESILEICLAEVEKKFQELIFNTINIHFAKSKGEYFLEIKELRSILSPYQTIDRLKLETKHSSHQIQKLIQNTFKSIKQEINQQKIKLINPFMYDTMMYRIQSAIQNASVVEYQEQNETYLSLIIKHQDYNQSIDSYIMHLLEQELDLWLQKYWIEINNNSDLEGIDKLVKTIIQKLEFINKFSFRTTISKIENKFSFEIRDYVSPSILEEYNKVLFDYHYSQSALFRLGLVIIMVAIIFILTDKIFGFIILFIQLINLFTGRDTKQLKLRHQTKEIKRIIDNKCQFLVRLIADKFCNNLCQYLESQSQEYQQNVNIIVEKVEEELEIIKQQITYNQSKIDRLKEDEIQIMKIIQD